MADAVGYKPETEVLFREEQSFRQWWLWLLILGLAGVFWDIALRQLLLGIPVGDNPAPDPVAAVLWVVFGVIFPLFMWYTRLITEVRRDGVYVCFFPFHLSFKKIPFAQIKSCEACTYSPIGDYGGWGIRYGFEGKAYNVSGNRGVRFVFTNGKRLLVGSQRPEAFVAAVEAALGKEAAEQASCKDKET